MRVTFLFSAQNGIEKARNFLKTVLEILLKRPYQPSFIT